MVSGLAARGTQPASNNSLILSATADTLPHTNLYTNQLGKSAKERGLNPNVKPVRPP
jgi:hypothetical protein